jgi:hypothetical protein
MVYSLSDVLDVIEQAGVVLISCMHYVGTVIAGVKLTQLRQRR